MKSDLIEGRMRPIKDPNREYVTKVVVLWILLILWTIDLLIFSARVGTHLGQYYLR